MPSSATTPFACSRASARSGRAVGKRWDASRDASPEVLTAGASAYRVTGSVVEMAVAAFEHAGCPQPLALTPGIWPGCDVMS